MAGDVRGAVDVWEAERALEGMEDEEMEFDPEEIALAYALPCDQANDEEDEDEEVVCTGERKADHTAKQNEIPCCPFEFEGPTTCTELEIDVDVEMDCGDVEMDFQDEKQEARTWSDVFEVEDDEDEQQS
jgi:hypothetical protein